MSCRFVCLRYDDRICRRAIGSIMKGGRWWQAHVDRLFAGPRKGGVKLGRAGPNATAGISGNVPLIARFAAEGRPSKEGRPEGEWHAMLASIPLRIMLGSNGSRTSPAYCFACISTVAIAVRDSVGLSCEGHLPSGEAPTASDWRRLFFLYG